MDKTVIEEKVVSVIGSLFAINDDVIVREAKLSKDLDLDEMCMLDLVLELENEFSVQISDDEEAKWKTVGDIVDFIDGLLNPQHTPT